MGTSARHRGARLSYADERRAARRAEVAALCSLVVVLLWGACLIPLPAGKAPPSDMPRSMCRSGEPASHPCRQAWPLSFTCQVLAQGP